LRAPPIISSIAEINLNHVTSNGTATTWSVNNLNEYTAVGTNGVGSDVKGNIQSYNGWSYTYDAQNRLRLAQGNGTTLEFWYDGKNRQITRRINGDNTKITRSVCDGRRTRATPTRPHACRRKGCA
jgi:hypothetical protein